MRDEFIGISWMQRVVARSVVRQRGKLREDSVACNKGVGLRGRFPTHLNTLLYVTQQRDCTAPLSTVESK